MTHRRLAMLLVMAMLGACLPASAADLVSPKLCPPASGLRVGTSNLNAAFDPETVPSDQPAEEHRQWNQTGKVLTIVGVSLIAGGAAAIVHGQNTTVACRYNTCAQIVWKDHWSSLGRWWRRIGDRRAHQAHYRLTVCNHCEFVFSALDIAGRRG
jgi:hypothetical protein